MILKITSYKILVNLLWTIDNPIVTYKFNQWKGRPTEAVSELQIKAYGAVEARSYIPGAEALEESGANAEEDADADSSAGDSDGSWVDVSDSDDDGWVNVSQDASDVDEEAEDSTEGENKDDEDENGWESVDGEDDEEGE